MLNLDTLTGSLTSNAIVNVSDVCSYLNLGTTASATSLLSSAISWVSSEFESYVGLPIKEQQFLGYYNGHNSFLCLNNYPITSLVSIKYRNSDTEGYTNDITNNVQVDGIGKYRLYYPYATFPCGFNPIQVIYNAGYSIVPYDIQKICIEAVAITYRESKLGESALGIQNRNVDGTVGLTQQYLDLTDKHKSVLDKYKKIQVF